MRLSKLSSICDVFFSTLFISFLIVGCSGGSSSGSTKSGGSTPVSTLSITTASSLSPGVVNSAYSNTLAATGGSGAYSWSVTSGSLPAGLSLNSSTGAISGTPTTAGSSSFTLQVADSESTPQKATLAATLVINAQLAITTTVLLDGQQNVAYSQQVTATGGTSPYTWSLATNAQLPAGLTLNSSGTISGTPTAIGSTAVGFVVTDSAKNTASANLNVIIDPPPATIADGTYAFVFSGTTPQGSPSAQNAVVINGTFTAKSGAVVAGFYDENTVAGPAVAEQAITGGTLTNSTEGLGYLTLNTSGGTMKFVLAAPASAVPGKDTAIRIVQFTDTDGSGTRGSGTLKPSLPVAATAGISGSFSFLFSGSDLNQKQEALVGSFKTDGAGNIASGNANSNEEGTLKSWDTVTGTYAVDGNGRGLFKLQLGLGTFSYSFYEVSPNEWMAISVDPATSSSPLVSGQILQQTGTSFTTASLPATSVFQVSGLAAGSSNTVPDITSGLATSDGSGNVTFNFDEYNGTLSTSQTLSVSYTVNAVTGRALPANASSQPILYIINSSSAFVLGADKSSSSGILKVQSGSPFANASFSGSYLGGSLPLDNTSALNENGLFAADGKGNVVLTTNRSTNKGLVQYQAITGTYAVDSKGRGVITTPDGITRIFYIVSSTEIVYMTSDTGGYLGSFAQ